MNICKSLRLKSVWWCCDTSMQRVALQALRAFRLSGTGVPASKSLQNISLNVSSEYSCIDGLKKSLLAVGS